MVDVVGTTNVPAISWTEAGPVVPSANDILTGVHADYNVAFSVDFNFSPTTPQGQLASTTAAVLSNAYQFYQWLVTQIDPAYAFGRMQDAIARIYFLERNPAEPTAVQVTCGGLEGTVIPSGALAKAADGNLYVNTADGIITSAGIVTLSFACTVPGPITCPTGSLNQIYQAINGWDSITNPSDGVLGRNTETRADFELRRRASVAQNSRGSLQAVQGAVLSVPNVLDAYVTENVLPTPATIGGVSLVAKSLYVAAVGGDAQAIGDAIWSKKAPGCDYNGNTTVTVVDDNPAYSPPLPSYAVKFQRPNSLDILFAINIVNGSLVPSDAVTQIQNAIIAAFAGSDGGARARIGSTIYATRYMAPLTALGAWLQIVTLKIGSENNPNATFTADISGTLMTVSAVSTGVLAVGETVSGAAVLPGTVITALGTGTGGTGTYDVAISQTVASETMKTSKPTRDQVAVQIDQVPTIDANNIAVTLT